MSFSERYDRLPPYSLGPFAEALMAERRAGRDVIDLGQLNPDLPTPALAVEKLVQASLLSHNHRYSASSGISRLRKAFAHRYQARCGVELDAETEVCVVNGSKEGLVQLLSVLLDQRDEVFLPTPAYPLHLSAVALSGARLVELPLNPQALLAALADGLKRSRARNKLVLCSFPHNPTGAVVDLKFFKALVDLARETGALIVNDAAYLELGYDDYQPSSLLEVPGAGDCAIEFYSLSKAYGVPGWRVAAALGNAERLSALKRLKSHIDFGVFQPLQIAAAALLENATEVLAEHRALYRARRDTLVDGLASVGWTVSRPQAGLFVWAEIPAKLKLSADEFSQRVLRDCGVALCPGSGFSPTATSSVRLGLAESEARIRLAVSRIGSWLGDFK